MPGKKIVSFKKLAKKVKDISRNDQCKQSHRECLLRGHNFDDAVTTPTGFFAIYVGGGQGEVCGANKLSLPPTPQNVAGEVIRRVWFPAKKWACGSMQCLHISGGSQRC
ncbi:hypothetical protein OIU74_028591 [Salix koriyanagi]|uniref:Uncharacterized protein n=1 Tax=Salix koriyanagi TaxID=2511006 RepID=A0A9Q0VCN4_9ROSI|nr:hypothetical protein OIU74_028591 [Salix koriyanagi]